MNGTDRPFSYDGIAADYARKVDAAPYNALYERPAMIAMLPSVEGKRILDAGCGSGWYSERLLAMGAMIDAFDASEAMVAYARERFGRLEQSLASRLTVQAAALGDALAFKDNSFDGAISALVLHYIKDMRPALREMHRVLKPGGWLLFSTHHPFADATRHDTMNYFVTERVTDHWDDVGDVKFYRRSLTEIISSVTDSGFTIAKVVEPLPTEEFRGAEPEAYARILKRPEFLIVSASVPAGQHRV